MSEQNQPGDKPKIYIDEDWKSRVQAEKERAAQEPPREEPKQAREPRGPLPPASFSFLVSTLSTQALVSLGAVENPLTGKPQRDLDQAKHFIDTLEMLKEKTRGNLSAEESSLIENVLHELHLVFVQTASTGPGAGPGPSEAKP